MKPAPHIDETVTPPCAPLATDAQSADEAVRAGEVAAGQCAPLRRNWSDDHAINVRLSIPLFFGRCYLTLVGGRERRSASRLVSERRKHPLATRGNIALFLVAGIVVGLACLALMQIGIALLAEHAGITGATPQ